MTKLATILRVLLLGGFMPGLPGHSCFLPVAFGQDAPQVENKVCIYVEQMPTLPGAGGGIAAIVETSPGGAVAVLAALRQLPTFIPGRQDGQLVRVSSTVAITVPDTVATPSAPSDPVTTHRREAQTRQQGLALRLPGEADTTFLRRVLPESYPCHGDLVAYAWRPSAFGKQLFFSTQDEEGNANILVPDPYQENIYTIQVLPVPSQGDITTLEALFFADTNHDGHKDLLALSSCSLKEQVEEHGELMFVHNTPYRTNTWQYLGLDKTGRPQYEQGPERPDLDELKTAAEVREALPAPAPRHRRTPAKAVRKPAKATK